MFIYRLLKYLYIENNKTFDSKKRKYYAVVFSTGGRVSLADPPFLKKQLKQKKHHNLDSHVEFEMFLIEKKFFEIIVFRTSSCSFGTVN